MAGELFAEPVGEAAIVPERLLLGLAETRPDFLANLRFSEVAKDGARIMDLVCQRHPKDIVISIAEMCKIGFLSLSPVRFALPFRRISQTVRARLDNPGHALTEAVANILKPRLPP